jgi:hypothetical protein
MFFIIYQIADPSLICLAVFEKRRYYSRQAIFYHGMQNDIFYRQMKWRAAGGAMRWR